MYICAYIVCFRSVFMGVFQQLPTEPDVATVWLMASGQILSCDALFTDWMSHKQDKIHMSECEAHKDKHLHKHAGAYTEPAFCTQVYGTLNGIHGSFFHCPFPPAEPFRDLLLRPGDFDK